MTPIPLVSAWISAIPIIVQTAFWITVGTIGLLTYNQAKRTVLQPLRTEVFKLQLESLTRLIKIFVGKDEIELRNHFGLKDIFHANAIYMMDTYARRELGMELDEKKRPYSLERCPQSIFANPEKYLLLATDHVSRSDSAKLPPETPDWAEYSYDHIRIPIRYLEAIDELESFLSDPLLPKACADLIEDLVSLLNKQINILRDVLTEKSAEMPDKYQTIEVMTKSTTNWIHNDWVRRSDEIKPAVNRIVSFARDYLGSDQFDLAPSRSRLGKEMTAPPWLGHRAVQVALIGAAAATVVQASYAFRDGRYLEMIAPVAFLAIIGTGTWISVRIRSSTLKNNK